MSAAACGCLQGRSWSQDGLGAKFKNLVESIGDHFLLMLTVLSTAFALLGLFIANQQGETMDVVETWLLSKAASQIYWFFFTGPVFAYK